MCWSVEVRSVEVRSNQMMAHFNMCVRRYCNDSRKVRTDCATAEPQHMSTSTPQHVTHSILNAFVGFSLAARNDK